MTCCYSQPPNDLPPCLVFTHKGYSNLNDFLSERAVVNNKSLLLQNDIGCISYNKSLNSISISQDHCISCGSCALSCPGGLINFTDTLKATPSCSNFAGLSDPELTLIRDKLVNFTGETLDSCNNKYLSFEKYTGINETKNISVWGGSIAKYIFGGSAKLGLEIPLRINGRDRNGRLDICVLSPSALVVIEAKVSLRKLMAEGRYEAQILAYDEELATLNLENAYKVASIRLLLIGDNETDLLPQEHDLCSSKVGNMSQNFYKSIIKNGIKFISARGLLSLAMSKFINPNFLADEYFIDAFNDPNTIGLLSNTLVKKNGNNIVLEPISP